MPLPTKVMTRAKNSLTGEEYYVGTVGTHEYVNIVLSTPEPVDWEELQLQVRVQNISESTYEDYDIDEHGRCTAQVPIGDQYAVILPVVGEYVQPADIIHVATMASRTISYTYETETRKELVAINAVVSASGGGTVEDLEDKEVKATDTLGNIYITAFDDEGKCSLEIPYGRTYTISFPRLGGYNHDHNNEPHTAGLPSREVLVHYTKMMIGLYGLDAQGNTYTIEQIDALADKSIIIAGAYNDFHLDNSPRGDGTYGNGFCWKIGDEIIGNYKWTDARVIFDTTRFPRYDNLGALKYAGHHFSNIIIEIGQDGGASDGNLHPTPAASACAEKTINIGGVDRNGFMTMFNQLYLIAIMNKTAFQAFYTALGITAPNLWNNTIRVCDQYGGNALVLRNGTQDTDGKEYEMPVFCAYDL